MTNDLVFDDAPEGFAVDFSDVPSMEPIPAGVYEASIVSAKPGKSRSGNPKIDLQWVVESGDHEGRRVFQTLSFHPNALFVTKAVLLGLGFPQDFSGSVQPDELVGISANIQVEIEQSDQINPMTGEVYEPRNRVRRVRPSNMSLEDAM